MMKKIWKWLLLVLGVAVILIGVPVLINECYKVGDGYITIWDAQDVLSYYGTLVGAVIAVATIALGQTWRTAAGKDFRYYMVFENEENLLPSAVSMSQFIDTIKEL